MYKVGELKMQNYKVGVNFAHFSKQMFVKKFEKNAIVRENQIRGFQDLFSFCDRNTTKLAGLKALRDWGLMNDKEYVSRRGHVLNHGWWKGSQ